jgi:hypothetical protein
MKMTNKTEVINTNTGINGAVAQLLLIKFIVVAPSPQRRRVEAKRSPVTSVWRGTVKTYRDEADLETDSRCKTN